MALKFTSVLNREKYPLILCPAVCIEPRLVLNTSCLVQVPSCAAATTAGPLWGTAMVTKCQWASGLAQTGIKHLCANMSHSVAFLWVLQ